MSHIWQVPTRRERVGTITGVVDPSLTRATMIVNQTIMTYNEGAAALINNTESASIEMIAVKAIVSLQGTPQPFAPGATSTTVYT